MLTDPKTWPSWSPGLLQCSDGDVTRCGNGHLPFSHLSVEKRLKTERSAQHQQAQLAAHSASSLQLLALFQGDKACGFLLPALCRMVLGGAQCQDVPALAWFWGAVGVGGEHLAALCGH